MLLDNSSVNNLLSLFYSCRCSYKC